MKRIILIISIGIMYNTTLDAQATNSGVARQPISNDKPVSNPYQLPNYYQNNSNFVNNSMQTNRPSSPNGGSFTGNADYQDPTRSMLFINKNVNNYSPANNYPPPTNNATINSSQTR